MTVRHTLRQSQYHRNSPTDRTRRLQQQFSLKHYLAGGICLLSLGLIFEQLDVQIPERLRAIAGPSEPAGADRCSKVVQAKTRLSRANLAKLLTIPEGKSRSQIRAIAQQPYCTLSPLNLRAGETTEREAYPLAFAPDTWLVVTYEGEHYAGFDFVVQ